jgi:hypothetical protein
MIVKEDLEEAKERMKNWWDHEPLDRPIISYHIIEGAGSEKAALAMSALNYDLAKDWDGIDPILDTIEKYSDGLVFGGENIPTYFPNYGPGAMAAVFGVEPEYKSGTMWFNKPTDVKDIVSVLEDAKLNDNNEWYARLKRTTEIAAKRGAKHNYCVAVTDLGGVLDILVSFLGPQNIIIQMRRNPELIDTCRAIIMEKYLKVYDELQDIINKYVDGCNTWLNVWCHKRYYTMQCDFSVMLNEKYFERFVLPDIIEQSEHMDYAIWHLDGPEEIKFLDYILPHVDGVQWVPGEKPGIPQDGADEWMPLYKKIQKSGTNNVMLTFNNALVPEVCEKLGPEGTFVYSLYLTRGLADCYLPKFVGGNGGEYVKEISEWAKTKGLKKVSRADIRQYALENNVEIKKSLVSQLFTELRKKTKGFRYIQDVEKEQL